MRDLLPEGPVVGLSARDEAFSQVQREFEAKISGLEAFSAGIKRENYVAAWANDKINKAIAGIDTPQYTDDPNYRFEDDEANFGYDPAVMVNAKSAAEAAAFRDQIDYEMQQLKIISANAWGTAGQIFGGVFNPHVAVALPVAGKSVIAAMILEAGLEAGSELVLHDMQKTRTMEESFWNVGLTAAGVGILGGAAKGIGAMRSVPRDVIDEINSGVMPGGVPDGIEDSVGARRTIQEDMITAEDDALIGGRVADFFSIGQMSNLVKSASKTARDMASRMADNPLFTRAHAQGKTRGVSVEALHEAAMGRVIIATDKAAVLQKKSGMLLDDFEQQVGVAMSQGDRHINPQVQQAAEMYRAEVIGPIQEAAKRLGLLESDEALQVKIKDIDEQIARLTDEGAGPGSAKQLDELEKAKAKVYSAAQKTTAKLEARVKTLEAKLEMARRPGADGKKRAAPKSMMDQYNKARSALTKHSKELKKKTAAQTREINRINRHNARLKKVREKKREYEKRLEQGGNLYAESYFPRVYDSDKIYANWEGLKHMLREHFRKDEKLVASKEFGEIEEMVLETMQNMVGGRAQSVNKRGVPTPLRARSLKIMDKALEPYLEKRASRIMLKHAQGLQPYILMREAFEGRTLEDLLTDVQREYVELIDNAPSAKEKKRLSKQMDKDVTRIRVMNDRLMHQVQRALDPQNAFIRMIQYSKLWNLTVALGGVVFSSLPDIARPIAHYGLRGFGKGVVKGFAQAFGTKQDIPAVQVRRTGAALQRTLNDRAMQLTDSLEPDSKWLLKGQKFWSKVTGFDWYTDIMESVASHAAMDYVVRQAAKVASEQPLSAGATKQLARMGLTKDDLVEIYHESMGTMGAQDSVLKYMNTMQWKNTDLARRTEAAIGSDVRRTIIRIGVGEKPAFMDSHMASWLLQFQSFAMSAQNKIMVAGFQNMNRHTAEGLIAMLALGYGVGASKAWLRGDDPTEWSYEQAIAEGIDRSGMIGALREPFNILRFAAAQQGWTDGVPSRYAGKGWERAITPPAASTLGYAGQGVYAAMGGDFEKAGDKFMRASPFINNTWHIRETLMRLGEM